MNVRPITTAFAFVFLIGAVLVYAGVLSSDLNEAVLFTVGALILIVSLRIPFLRKTERSIEPIPETGRRPSVPVPGATLSSAIAQFRHETAGFESDHHRVISDLRGAAIEVLSRFGGRTEAKAIEAVDSGEWTDDSRVGELLASGPAEPDSLTERATSIRGGAGSFEADTHRAAAEIAAIAIPDTTTEASGDGSGPLEAKTAVAPTTHRTTTDHVDGIVPEDASQTGHWTGISFVGLTAIGAGIVASAPAAVLAGGIGIGYAGVARAFQAPTPSVAVDRSVSDPTPEPGDEIDVRLTIENESGRLLPDLRITDGVPAGLAIESGAARLGTALRPGETASLEYTLTARRGTHRFDPVSLVTRDPTGAVERTFIAGCSMTINCEPRSQSLAAAVPLRRTAAGFSGRLTTDDGGPGTEFHSIREYRTGDPLNRVDWNTCARTGELATLRFHEERAARVLVLIDARQAAYRAPGADEPHAVDRAADAAGPIAASLIERGDTVGLSAVGPTTRPGLSEDPDPCWLAPSSGDSHEVRLQRLLAEHPQLSTIPPEDTAAWSGQLRLLRRRLDSGTQILFVTPLCDYGSMAIARRLDSQGHPVTVVSPDPTATETASQQLAGVARRMRAFDLEALGIPVVDWPHDEPIEATFERVSTGGRG